MRDSLLAKCANASLGAAAVTQDTPEPLPPEADLALAWSDAKVRAPLSIALQLDRRLARIVMRTTEPMLGQMRLAWWREALGKLPDQRPRGDVVLDGIGLHWQGRESALAAMVDGWEVLVTAEKIGADEAKALAAGRGAFFPAVAGVADTAAAIRLANAGCRWALADAAAAISDPHERDALVAAGLAVPESSGPLTKGARGLAVLDALAARALRRGGRPLMEGRGASLIALRAAIFRK